VLFPAFLNNCLSSITRVTNMWLQYSLPAVITLPMATIYMTYHSMLIPKNSTSTISVGSCNNCTHKDKVKLIAMGQDIVSKLTEINITEENQSKIINMLDTLEWVKIKNVPRAHGDYFFARARWCNLLMRKMYSDFLNDKSGHLCFILIHVCYMLACHIILKHSILGVLSKIVINQWKSFMLYSFHSIDTFFTCLKKHFTNLLKRKENDGEGGTHTNEDQDVTEQCSTENLRSIDSEEVLARENQEEEKNLCNPTPTTSASGTTTALTDRGYESFLRCISDDDDDDVVRRSTPRDDYYNLSESRPEKFKQFLIEKNENIEKMGISITEDGYIEDDESGDESLICSF